MWQTKKPENLDFKYSKSHFNNKLGGPRFIAQKLSTALYKNYRQLLFRRTLHPLYSTLSAVSWHRHLATHPGMRILNRG